MHVFIITGSIATGKSTLLAELRRLQVPCLNADSLVHQLLARGGGAVAAVGKAFPQALRQQAIDRSALGSMVFKDAKKLRQLELLLHPMVRRLQQHWICEQRRLGTRIVAIEIPLWFESRYTHFANPYAHKRHIIVSSCSPWLMKRRSLARASMTPQKLRNILSRQWPTSKKIRFADSIIHTGIGVGNSRRAIQQLLKNAHINKNAKA